MNEFGQPSPDTRTEQARRQQIIANWESLRAMSFLKDSTLGQLEPQTFEILLDNHDREPSATFAETVKLTHTLGDILSQELPTIEKVAPTYATNLKNNFEFLITALIGHLEPWTVRQQLMAQIIKADPSDQAKARQRCELTLREIRQFVGRGNSVFEEHGRLPDRLATLIEWFQRRTAHQRLELHNKPPAPLEFRRFGDFQPDPETPKRIESLLRDPKTSPIPPELLHLVRIWRIMSEQHPRQTPGLGGIYQTQTISRPVAIELYPEFFRADRQFQTYILTHELAGHGLDPRCNFFHPIRLLSFNESLEMMSEWEAIVQGTEKGIFPYLNLIKLHFTNLNAEQLAEKLSKEDFAETITTYLVAPNMLRQAMPLRYRFASQWLNRLFPAMQYSLSRPQPQKEERDVSSLAE